MTDPLPTLSDLAADPARAMSLTLTEATALLAQAGAAEAVLRARIAVTINPLERRGEPYAPEGAMERMLTLPEAAQRARKSARWVRDHWRTEMPFAVRKGRTVLFPERPFEKWLKRS